MKKETTRLHFSEEDLENAAVSRAAGKAERAADRADAAKARLPTKGKLRDEKEKTAFYAAGNGNEKYFFNHFPVETETEYCRGSYADNVAFARKHYKHEYRGYYP